MPETIPVITLDGPSGSGKGTMAFRLSRLLGWNLLDSGALYRIIGYQVLTQSPEMITNLEHETSGALNQEIAKLAEQSKIAFIADNSDNPTTKYPIRVYLNHQEVTTDIRTEEVGKAASLVARLPEVRKALLKYQIDSRTAPGLIADGRDMGTSIFPDATLKFYLTASAETRAKRRLNQLQADGKEVSLPEVLSDIEARDIKDKQRAASPLKPAADAIIVDSSELDIDEVYSTLEKCLREKHLLP